MRLLQRRREWGIELSGFGRPFGLGEDREGGLLVTDMDCHVLVRFHPQWRSYELHDGSSGWTGPLVLDEGVTRERPAVGPRGWNGPHSVVEDAGGRLLVCCYYTPMIAAVSGDGRCESLVRPSILSGPATARVDRCGRILVAEYSQNLVLAFALDGRYIGRLGRCPDGKMLHFDREPGAVPASPLPGGFDRPHMAATLSDGSVLVADTWNNRLQHFTAQGELLLGSREAVVPCPVAIDQDIHGHILATAWGTSELLLFSSAGLRIPLHQIPKLNKPYDARFFRKGLAVADSHNGRVLVLDCPFVDT